MRKSIATVSMSGTLEHKLEAISAAGFDGIELFENDFLSFPGSARDLRRMAGDLGLAIYLYQPLRDFEGMPEAQFRRGLDKAERKFDVMQELAAPLMLCCSNTSVHAIDDHARAAAQLHELAQRASRRGLGIGYEALAWGRHVKYYRQAWSIVRQADHPSLGLILDSFHTLSLGDDPSGIASIPGDKIFFVQMADAPYMSMDVTLWARHHRNFPGQGQFDVEGFLLQALRAGYRGPLSLEIFNDVFREVPNRRTAVDAMRSLLYLESQVGPRLLRQACGSPGRHAQDARGSAPALPPPLPAAPDPHGVAFVEMAVGRDSLWETDALLSRMGFRQQGRHRSKEAFLYRMGDLAIILDAQPDAFVRSRFPGSGPMVCGIGLRVGNPEAALARAVALKSARCDGRGRAVDSVPAIVCPGGMALYFLPASAPLAELPVPGFEPIKNVHPADMQVFPYRLDHLTLSLTVDQRDTWVLFLRAVLGLESRENAQFADPFGLINTSGVASANRELRFLLNVSQSRHTSTARIAEAAGGAAVHGIGLACTDIFAVAALWKEQGMPLCKVSRNYYDDLALRFDLSEEFVASLSRYGILYDCAQSSGYFHLYTRNMADRLFFELVQRDGGYDAYGILNSTTRLAQAGQEQDPVQRQ